MKRIFFAFLLLICSFPISIIAGEFLHPAIISFETGVLPAQTGKNSVLTVSADHYKHQQNSLKWIWYSKDASWNIKAAIPYHIKQNGDNGISTFVFWVYAAKPQEGDLKVEFLKDGRVCSYFIYHLNFTGWRGAWLAFDRDMQGKPEEGMNEMRVTSIGSNAGELYFDHIILSADEDSRQHTADFQAPYINPLTDTHWLILLKSWNKQFDLNLPKASEPQQNSSIQTIESRLKNFLLEGKKPVVLADLKKEFEQYGLTRNSNGSWKGLPVFFERYGETYTALDGPNYQKLYADASGLSKTCDFLLKLAVTYTKTTNEETRAEVGKMYIQLMQHLQDQGFQAGSAMGTLHHLGYSIRNFYPAALLMKDLLRENALLISVQQACEWFAGTGEIKTAPSEPGMDIDAFNTSLIGRLVSVLLIDETSYKTRYMKAFKRWLDNGFLYTPGTEDGFKPDGSIYHHRHNYPAYAIGGLEGAVTANYLLYGTTFQLHPTGRAHLKDALLSMRFYCNLQTWPLSLSGRHPDGKGHLIPVHYALMALTGNPDYSEKTDKDLASAYLRLETKTHAKYCKQFLQMGLQPEPSPEGNRNFSYSCLNVHRRKNWMVSAMGFSRYLWATETYPGANMYGRYLNYGNLQITATGDPVSNFGSGFRQEGWDWNHFPGTTATELPLTELRANVINPDKNSGNEEMLLSDETFAGGLSFQGKQGIFAMKLHENPKYGGTLKARKSVFFFDNRIVALGSNIRSALPDKEVHTTLFQVYQSETAKVPSVNSMPITAMPFSEIFKGKTNHFSDGLNNHFFVSEGEVVLQKKVQDSFHEETDAPTRNPFASAWINHGTKATTDHYEYLILVQPDSKTIETTRKNLKSVKKSPYEVLQKDSLAHIVHDKLSNTTAFAFFEAGKFENKNLFVSVSLPALFMMQKISETKLHISLADPDLRFYEGAADEEYDANGRRIERSVYTRHWINNPSGKSEIDLILSGEWKTEGNPEYFQVKSAENGKTTLTVNCQHGFSREASLVKVK